MIIKNVKCPLCSGEIEIKSVINPNEDISQKITFKNSIFDFNIATDYLPFIIKHATDSNCTAKFGLESGNHIVFWDEDQAGIYINDIWRLNAQKYLSEHVINRIDLSKPISKVDPKQKRIIIIDEGIDYNCENNHDVVKAIKEEYHRHDICIGELLNNIEISGCSVQEVVDIFGTVINDIEEKDFLLIQIVKGELVKRSLSPIVTDPNKK